MPFERMNKIC